MKNKALVLSLTATCIALLVMLIFIGGFRTNFFHRQLVKLGWVEFPGESANSSKCVEGWHNTLQKLDVDVDVAFYGNSITAGSDFRPYFPDVAICNLGCPSDGLADMQLRAYTIASVHPEKVFVMGGINYLKQTTIESFTRQYRDMVEAIREACPNASIYLQSILPVRDRELTMKVKTCNAVIDSLASAYGYPFIDLFPLYEKDGCLNETYSTDGVHLKPEHYSKWAQAIRRYVYE